jgi:hypothetical protein
VLLFQRGCSSLWTGLYTVLGCRQVMLSRCCHAFTHRLLRDRRNTSVAAGGSINRDNLS